MARRFSAGGLPRRCVREGSMSAMERTTYRRSLVAGGLVVSAFAILVAVLNSDVTPVLIDKATVSMGKATRDQSATHAASNQPPNVNTPNRQGNVKPHRSAL